VLAKMIFLPVIATFKAKLISTKTSHMLAASDFLKNIQTSRTLLAGRRKIPFDTRLAITLVECLFAIVAEKLLTLTANITTLF